MELINFLFGGIGLVLVSGAYGLYKRRKRKPVGTRPYVFRQPGIEDLKRTSKVLLVDDKEFEYLEPLKDNGYQVDRWTDVKSVEDIVAGDYAVVLLDLYGIGKGFSSKDHGLAVLSALRSRLPAALIAVYSASKWDVGQQRFFPLADKVIDKARSGFVDFSEALDELLLESVNPQRYIDLIAAHCDCVLDLGDKEAIREVLTSSSPHDSEARMVEIREVAKPLAAIAGQPYGDVHSIVTVATRRMAPWTTSR